jgi:hypothetical protein
LPGRALRRRLDRLAEAARRRVWDRQRLRDNVAAWAAIAPALAAVRIDPASIGALHGLAGAADALARLGDGPELQHADAEFAAADSRPARRLPARSRPIAAPRWSIGTPGRWRTVPGL